MMFPAISTVWFIYVFRTIAAGSRGKWLRCVLYKLSGSSDTSAAVSSYISNVVPYIHSYTNGTALLCIHCVRAVHHETVIVFVR